MKKAVLFLLIITKTFIFSLDEYIGLIPSEVINTFGPPDYIYSERGDREVEDDIIFFYNNRLYVYFNQNRVWQVRVDEQFKSNVLKIKIGDDKNTVKEILGIPYKVYEDSILYKREDQGFPLFLRIYYENDKVNDIYLFRGDY